MNNIRCKCLTCDWEGTYEQLIRATSGDVVCPACGNDEIEFEGEK